MKKRELFYCSISQLKPYPKNSNTHSDAHLEQIKKSIVEFGFTNPLLIDDSYTILAGHGRFYAAQRLNLVSVPCVMISGLTTAQKKAYVIADNQIAKNAKLDQDILRQEMDDLKALDFDLSILGFDFNDLDDFKFDDPEENKSENLKFEIKVKCKSDEEMEELFHELKDRGYSVRI